MNNRLLPGDPVPRFAVPARHVPRFHFDSVGGRIIVLSFIGGAMRPGMTGFLADIAARPDVFDNVRAAFFAVSNDPADATTNAAHIPSHAAIHLFWDFAGEIAGGYGARGASGFAPATFIIDPALRLLAILPIADPARHAAEIFASLAGLPDAQAEARPAPVLVLPRVLEPELCRRLIAYYEGAGSVDSGFMREENGLTVGVLDYKMKRRRDSDIADDGLKAALRERIERRLVPEIRRAFNFQPTRIERYIVACYDAGEGGYFRPHRDNTTKGTAHRRFAVTINLNAEEYEGGELRFPEFGPQTYRASTGGAVVFGCSLLHEATPVRRGRRYCTLPFLYDEEGHALRERNLKYLASETPQDRGAA
ncbi:MAG: 2OG-Fe(II) oxygenase [Alphaproteobacteria bacterium]|nr:2OG-Fe(II) oxygenase [Alphaproteobacteria bacterium]